MAGTVTTVEELGIGNVIHKVAFTWLSDASGDADGVSTNSYTGEIVRVVQIPDGGGTQPTNLYDVVVNDDDGADLLIGEGANLSNAANTDKVSGDLLGVVANAPLSLVVSNAGNAKGGQTIVYIKVR